MLNSDAFVKAVWFDSVVHRMAGWNDPLGQSLDRWLTCSLLVKVLELRARLLLAGRDDAVAVNVDQALGLHLVDDVGGLLILLSHPVVVGELLFRLGDECQLGIELGLPVRVSLLLGGYLVSGSSSLAAHFEHVGTNALGV